MEEVLQWIQKLLTDYGAVNVIIMVLAIILTNLIKRPIVNKAESFVESAKKLTGVDVDKSVITSFICIIPIAICFIFYFIYGLIQINWNIAELDWSQVLSNAVIYGFLSISIFETAKGFIKAYISKKNYNEAKKQLAQAEIKEEVVDETVDLIASADEEEAPAESEELTEKENNAEEQNNG